MEYRLIDHTADIAFEAFGDSLEELLRNSARAFYDALVFTDKLKNGIKKEIEIEDYDADYLLYKWLNELLFLFDTEFFAAKEVDVSVTKSDGKLILKGNLMGGKLTPEMIRTEPKAITMHKFKVEKREKGWYAFVIVDI
jgi:SHS2 domain-containing protein